MRYSIELRERRFVKGYGFMSFARNFGNRYGKKLMNTAIETSTNFNSKYGKKLTDTVIKTGKDFATIAGKKIVHNTAEATGDLIGNKIADKITSASKNHIMKKYSQIKLIMKYQKKDIFLQKKDKKLLMN